MFFKKRKLNKYTIDPDEILMDSKNIPDFDKYQFEGRLEKPITKKTFISIGIIFFIFGSLLLVRIAYLEISKGDEFALRSKNNYLRAIPIFPIRGIIYDRNNKELAWNESLIKEENLKFVRSYSELKGLSNVLGYVGIGPEGEMIGIDGIEKKYDDILSGVSGVKLVETDSKNEIKSESIERPPQNSEGIKLTIDTELQSAFYNILDGVIKDRKFGGGSGVILDVNSGDVLSLVSWPEYNSQILSRGEPASAISEYLNDKQKPFVNRAISGLYAPGSIVKPFIALASLNEKIVSPDRSIFSSGSISLPNPFFPDKKNIFYDWKAHGWVDMKRALAVSSNVYFYTLGGGYDDIQGLGIKKIDYYASLFGFGSKTNIDLDKEESGLIPSPDIKAINNPSDPIWRIGDTYNASIGQGDFQITPLQAAIYAAILATSGRILQPHLFSNVIREKGEDENFKPSQEKTVPIPAEYFKIVKEGMYLAATEGTAKGLGDLGIKIAAKTGTAELDLTSAKFVSSWLIAYMPYDNPRIALSILLERGNPTNLIGAVFVAHQLINWMIVNTPQYLTPSH